MTAAVRSVDDRPPIGYNIQVGGVALTLCLRCAAEWMRDRGTKRKVVVEKLRDSAFGCSDCSKRIKPAPAKVPTKSAPKYRAGADPYYIEEFETLLAQLSWHCPAGRRIWIPGRSELENTRTLNRKLNVFILHGTYGLSTRRIAEKLGCSHATVAADLRHPQAGRLDEWTYEKVFAKPIEEVGKPSFTLPEVLARTLADYGRTVLVQPRQTGKGWEFRVRRKRAGEEYPFTKAEIGVAKLFAAAGVL